MIQQPWEYIVICDLCMAKFTQEFKLVDGIVLLPPLRSVGARDFGRLSSATAVQPRFGSSTHPSSLKIP